MPYSPEDIVAYEFRPKTRGYDRDEVDGFLDALADQIEEAAKEQEAARAQLGALEAQLAEAQQSESALKRAFITVQEASDRALAEAQEEVARLREEVAKELEELRERTSREAMATQLRAEDEARDLLATAERAAAEQRQRVGELQRIDADHRQRLRAHLEDQFAALQALEDPFAPLAAELPPPPAPQAWDRGVDGQHDEGAAAPHDAGDEPWTDAAHDAEVTAGAPGEDQQPGAEVGTGQDPDHPGAADGSAWDAEHAASLEDEVAGLWRLRDDDGHDVATPSGEERPGGENAPASDEASDEARDEFSDEHADRAGPPSDEH